MKMTFTHSEKNPLEALRDAKRIVAIATEAEDAVLLEVVDLIRKKILRPKTCKHPGKALSQETVKLNKVYEDLAAEVLSMFSDELPF